MRPGPIIAFMQSPRRMLISLLLVLAASLFCGVGADAQEGFLSPSWEYLGPSGSEAVLAFALSPSWPTDQTIVAATRGERGSDILRTVNGGRTWDRFTGPRREIRTLVLPDSDTAARVVFAMDDWQSSSLRGSVLYRSPDGGETWRDVLTLDAPSAAGRNRPRKLPLEVSPSFSADGLAFIVADGRLRRTDDRGETWQMLDPAGGQRVQQLVFSPAFASDGTIFIVALSHDIPPTYTSGALDAPLPVDHIQSIGILKSVDRGATWQPATAGLDVDGVPYRQISSLAISPTYDADGILFAYAWGPWEDVEVGSYQFAPGQWKPRIYRAVHTALFRSGDGGATWAPVLSPSWQPWREGVGASPAYALRYGLSPQFATDGAGILAVNGYGMGAGSRSSWCSIHVSVDHGVTWEPVDDQVIRQGHPCGSLLVGRSSAGPIALTEQCSMGVECRLVWASSRDGGRSWERLTLPQTLQNNGSTEQAIARDGTAFFAGQGGIWKLGPLSPTAP